MSALKSLCQKSVKLVWIAGVLIILSCRLANISTLPQPTNTVTAFIPPSATAVSATTATQSPTPTLGVRSLWRTSRIAFVSNRTGSFQIYLMQPDGSTLTRLTSSVGDNLSPAWSPDDKHIAFESTRDGNSEIYVMNPDGTGQKNLTNDTSTDHFPVWLNNDRIAFASNRNGWERIFTVNLDGTDLQSFRYTSIDPQYHWICIIPDTSDGIIAFSREGDGKRETQVVDTNNGQVWVPDLFNTESKRDCPIISHFISNLSTVFISNRDGQDQIYKYTQQGNIELQLTTGSTPSLGPSRSMDGSWMVFYSKRTGNWDIFVMNINGKDQWDITNNPADDIQPAWEPY